MSFIICDICKNAIEGNNPRHLHTIRCAAWEKYGYGENLGADFPLPHLKIIARGVFNNTDCDLCGGFIDDNEGNFEVDVTWEHLERAQP